MLDYYLKQYNLLNRDSVFAATEAAAGGVCQADGTAHSFQRTSTSTVHLSRPSNAHEQLPVVQGPPATS